jgi:hypothetical protein
MDRVARDPDGEDAAAGTRRREAMRLRGRGRAHDLAVDFSVGVALERVEATSAWTRWRLASLRLRFF